jgi:type VII secretion integral membrane protein EccD
MTAQAIGAGEVCRLTVYGPRSRVELAVPAHVPVADIMPTVLGYLGPQLADAGLAHGGWVLQQLGGQPLDEDQSTAALGLYDGDVLHLRARNDQLPPVDYDDLADGVADTIADRSDAWRPRHTAQLALVTGGVLLAIALVLLPTLATGLVASAYAAVVAALLVGAAAGFVRGYGARGAGAVLSAGGIAFAGLAGLVLAGGHAPISWAAAVSPAGLLAAGGLVAVVALAARGATGTFAEVLVAVAVGGTLVALTGLIWAAIGGVIAAAASVLPIALLLSYQTPMLAARMTRLTVEPPAVTPEDFQEGLDPVPAADLRRRAIAADAHVTATSIAIAVVVCGLLAVLATGSGLAGTLLIVAVSVLMLLHARELIGARQRYASLAIMAVGLVALFLPYVSTLAPPWRLVAFAGLAWGAVVAGVVARWLPGRRLLPRWGLLGDIAHWIVASSILPLAIGATGLYGRVRGAWL